MFNLSKEIWLQKIINVKIYSLSSKNSFVIFVQEIEENWFQNINFIKKNGGKIDFLTRVLKLTENLIVSSLS